MTDEQQMKVFQFIEKSGETLAATHAYVMAKKKEQAACQKMAASVAATLVAQGLIDADEKPKALEKLSSSTESLKITANLLELLKTARTELAQTKAASGPGEAIEDSQNKNSRRKVVAAFDGSAGGYIGLPPGHGETTAADMAFHNALHGGF